MWLYEKDIIFAHFMIITYTATTSFTRQEETEVINFAFTLYYNNI